MGETYRALRGEGRSGLESMGRKRDWQAATPYSELCCAPLPKALGVQGSQLPCTLKPLWALTRPSMSPCSRFHSP